MKTRVLTFTAPILLILAGCAAPELAQSSLSPMENEWKTYIQRSYPAWNPPKTVPPASSVEEPKIESVDLVEPGEIALTTPLQEEQFEPLALETESVVELVPEPVADNVEYHTVRKGDTLWKIASKFYQNGAEWRRIYEANVDVLPDPAKLKPGIELRIPPK